MGIFDNILGFFKKDENFEKYLINDTIKAYNKDTTADKKLEDYIKDKICLNDKVSIIKFIEFFKDAINYTKWFDDNKERMESRTINKSKESKNLFDSDYTDGSVIDMFIGGDTDTDDKKLFEEAITKILTVLKTPSDIKDLNVLTLCVMTKINHYLAKFSFYMCVKNVEISRVNKIADIMGSFIKTNQNNLISNYENEICKLLKCNLIDLETFVNNLPIKDIANHVNKQAYMNCMKDISALHDNIRTLQKNVINVQSYNTYADYVNKYISNINVKEEIYNDFVNNDNVKIIIQQNKALSETNDVNIVKTIMNYNFETKGDNIEYKDVIEDLNNVYSYLNTLEILYHCLKNNKTIEFTTVNKDNFNFDEYIEKTKIIEAARAGAGAAGVVEAVKSAAEADGATAKSVKDAAKNTAVKAGATKEAINAAVEVIRAAVADGAAAEGTIEAAINAAGATEAAAAAAAAAAAVTAAEADGATANSVAEAVEAVEEEIKKIAAVNQGVKLVKKNIDTEYIESLKTFITNIKNGKFDFVFDKMKKINDSNDLYDRNNIIIKNLEYKDDLSNNIYNYFPTTNNFTEEETFISTIHVLCLFRKILNVTKDFKNFISSYMRLRWYTIKDSKVDNDDNKILDTDVEYVKNIYKQYSIFRNDISTKFFEHFQNIVQSSISSLIQYIYIINDKSYDDRLKKLTGNINKYYNTLEYDKNFTEIRDIIYHLYMYNYNINNFTKKILPGATKDDNVSEIYTTIQDLLKTIYYKNNIIIEYLDIYILSFNDLISKLTNIDKIYEDMQKQINDQIESKIKTIKDNEKEHKLKIENKLEQHINKDYIDDIKSNLFNLIRQTEERDIKTILKYEYNGKNIDVPTDDNYKKVKGQIKTYENTLNVVKNIKDNQLIENNTNFSKESTNLNNLITLYDNVKGNEKIKNEATKTEICKEIKELINTAISVLNATYTQICKYVNDNFLSGFNKFKNGLIKSTDDVVIQHVWFNALRKIHNIQSIQDIEKTEKPKNKYNILSLVNRKSTEIPKGDSQLIDKFFLNNHVPFNAANITSRINKISGGYKDDIECMNIYEQIFKRIQDILASRKIKLNASDTERINDKIKKLKRTEKRLLEIFKTMAYYTSIPDLTRRSDVSYDDMNETIDEYKHKYEEYHKLTDNMINSLNKLNKIVTEITNNINA